jgi:hypothetical protein
VEEHPLKHTQVELIHAIYQYHQYHSSDHVKGDLKDVNQRLWRLKISTAQQRFLQASIEMRTIGLVGNFADS